MCLTFDDKDYPYMTTTGLWVSPSASGLYPGVNGIYGYGLRFDGGNLEVPAFNNKVSIIAGKIQSFYGQVHVLLYPARTARDILFHLS